MGNLTLHAEGNPVCSFTNSAATPIDSLKVYFTPRQEGSGDPSPNNVREIEGWTGLTVYKDDVYLPVEYQRVEYLESSASINSKPYINTNIIPNNNMRIIVKGQTLDNITSAGFIFGSRVSSTLERFWGIVWRNEYEYGLGNKQNTKIADTSKNQDFIFDFNNNASYRMTVNDESVTGTIVESSQTYTYPIFIFAINTNGSFDSQVTPIRIKQFTIYNSYTDTVPSMNLIPCLRKFDSKPGMYDTVSGNFYINSGTGEFLYGATVSETIPITFPVSGKNKFNYANANIKDKYRLNDNGNEVTDSSGSYCQTMIAVIPNMEYTLSGYAINNVSKCIYYFTKDGDFISRGAAFGDSSYTFTVPSNCYYIQIQNREVSNGGWDTIQLELGSTATTYEPYSPNNTVYGGYIDLAKGEVVAEYEYMTDTWGNWGTVTDQDDGTELRYKKFTNPVYGNGPAWTYSYCNVAGYSYNNNNGTTHFYIVGNSYNCRIYLPSNTDTSTVIQAVGKLITPIIYPISPTQLTTFLGPNSIWSSAAEKVECDYELHETKAIAAAKKRIAANQPHLATTSPASIATFNTDMKAPLKSCKVYFKPVQEGSGDPSPTNVRAISGWTEANVILSPTLDSQDGTTISLNWQSTAGTVYGGWVNLVTGEVWREWYLYRLPRLTSSNCAMGSQSYIKSDSVDLFKYPEADVRQYPSVSSTLITYSPMCNRLDFKPKGIWSNVGYPNCWTLNKGQVHFNISNNLLGITDYTQESMTTAKEKVINYMNSMYDAGNYFEFVYKITPTIITTLTTTQLKTLTGTNNIWSNSNDNIEVKYWTH